MPQPEVEWLKSSSERRLVSAHGHAPHSLGVCMIHDLVLSLVFLSMIIAPALVAIRADNDQPEF
jgi:hypothetical protein